MQQITRYNGNEQRYTLPIPKLFWITKYVNDVALAHVKKNTGLEFKKGCWGYEAQPVSSLQVMKLLVTYNFKTQYHDNATNHNTLFLKDCGNEGFKVDVICYDCCKDNGIYLRKFTRHNLKLSV